LRCLNNSCGGKLYLAREGYLVTNRENDWLGDLDKQIMTWLWRPERPKNGPVHWGNMALQMFYLAGRNSIADRVPFQANALTFITLLALVPTLAISFSVAKGLGFSETLQQALIDNEFVVGQRDILQQILGYVQNTQVGTLGAVGLVALVVALVFTISTMEETFNRIWDVPAQRSWPRKFTDYLSVLIICPLLILGATGAWAAFASHEFVRWVFDVSVIGGASEYVPSIGPWLLLLAAFVFIYLFLPNTKVPWASALLAGSVAALLWFVVQNLYIQFQVGVARYNAIYGGFASLPLFMIWMQVSWTVVLYGAQISRAHHVCRFGPLPRIVTKQLSPHQRENLALTIMTRAARRFHKGEPPYSQSELSQELDVMQREIKQVVDALEEACLVNEVGLEGLVQPARSLDVINLQDVVDAVRGPGSKKLPDPEQAGEQKLKDLLVKAAEQERDVLSRTSLLELACSTDDRSLRSCQSYDS
jgi:membrane protein